MNKQQSLLWVMEFWMLIVDMGKLPQQLLG